jgi:hypothetical protein
VVTGQRRSLPDLFRAARRVPPPSLDVTCRVLDTLRAGPAAPRSDAPLWLAAAVSVAAAAAVLLLVFIQSTTINDPFVQWFSSYVVAL